MRWRKVPAAPVNVPACSRSRWRRMLGQVPPVVVSMIRMSSSEPAQDHVGADALFEAVVDRAQVEHGFHVPPAAFKGKAGMPA